MQVIFLALLSCGEPATECLTRFNGSDDTAAGVADELDLTQTIEEPPASGVQFATPILEVPPYSEVIYCYFGTYTGEDVGVISFWLHTVDEYNHHSRLLAVDESEPPDGTLMDCLNEGHEPGGPRYEVLFQAIQVDGAATTQGDWLALPDGYAVSLKHGQRWTLETHYINPTDKTVLVNDAINLEFMAAAEVTHWVAAFEHYGQPNIPAQSTTTESVHCTWEDEFEILTLFGHMHESGTHFSTDWTRDGVTERIYEVDQWHEEYRDNPLNITTSFSPGELVVQAGDVFTTQCTWVNNTDQDLVYPNEMCSLSGAFGPKLSPESCAGSASR